MLPHFSSIPRRGCGQALRRHRRSTWHRHRGPQREVGEARAAGRAPALAVDVDGSAATNQPVRLDCATRQSTEHSLVVAFSCSVEALRQFVADTAHSAYYEEHWQRLDAFDRWFYQRACEQFGQPMLPTEICWFHGTRVPDGTTFAEGVLPLGAWLPRLQESVLATLDDELAKRQVEAAFERQGGFGMHFRNKVKDSLHWGPFAILVREVADHAKAIGQHDYLAMPEIIEDLCEDVKLASGLDLLSDFEERWKPAMVKFIAPAGDSADFALAIALCYLRECALNGRPGFGAVWCFDGHNQAIPPERILSIEWVQGPA